MSEDIDLPPWAMVSDKRRHHIARVTAQIDEWARALALSDAERQEWHDAARFHDALRDAPETMLRELASGFPVADMNVLHGPAVEKRLRLDGENRVGLLEAVRWHTIGHKGWTRTGKALFMADFLEPGRSFARAERTYLAQHVPGDFEGTFRQVVRMRLEWTLAEGKPLFLETVELWNDIRS
jgi:2-amino-4-hydroxy-6-hydroxymethyldihydropteridine diphosphokinase